MAPSKKLGMKAVGYISFRFLCVPTVCSLLAFQMLAFQTFATFLKKEDRVHELSLLFYCGLRNYRGKSLAFCLFFSQPFEIRRVSFSFLELLAIGDIKNTMATRLTNLNFYS